jgi:DNA-binding HxlR family transcriptional regulator
MSSDRSHEEKHEICPVVATMHLLNGKWTLHILRELMAGRRRFNELARALGPVSSRTLCCRLRALEEQGIVVREIKHTIPPWVEYELTEKGHALSQVIDSIARWGRAYMDPNGAAGGASAEECCPEEGQGTGGQGSGG